MSNVTFLPETNEVRVESEFVITYYTWLEYWSYGFVMAHMHYNGIVAQLLTGDNYDIAYCLYNGFGRGLTPEQAKAQDYDFSHVRDSTPSALADVAQAISHMCNWNKPPFVMAREALESALANGLDPVAVVMGLKQ